LAAWTVMVMCLRYLKCSSRIRFHHLLRTPLGGAVTVLAPADPQHHAADAPLRADGLTALPIPATRSWVAQMAASADDTAAPVGGK
jgi:hypothetical protein